VSYEEEDETCQTLAGAVGNMCHMRRRIHVSYEEEDETCQTLAGAVGNMLIGPGFYISFRQSKVDEVYLQQV